MLRFFRSSLLVIALSAGSPGQAAEVIFRDDFNSPQLQSGWSIIRPDAATYSLTSNPGFFRVLTVRGLLGEEGTARNLLVRPITGDFIIDTRLEFNPRDGQPFAGLLAYQDDAHAVTFGLVFASGSRGAFRGVIMLNVGDNVDPNVRPAARYDETNTSSPNVIYLRLLRQGNQFVAAYSSDGITFRDLGTVTNDLSDTINIGIGAANGDSPTCGSDCDVSIPALFDYFQVSEFDGGGGPVQGVLESVDIQGPGEIVSGATGQFAAMARFIGNGSEDVTDLADWQVAPPDVGNIEGGIFTAETVSEETMATVVATYSHSGEAGLATRTDAVLVRIVPETGRGRVCGIGAITLFPCFIFLALCRKGENHSQINRVFAKTYGTRGVADYLTGNAKQVK